MKKFLLFGLTLACFNAFAGSETNSPASSPAENSRTLTFLIVHGAWGGGWDWKHVDHLLTAGGNTVYRPTLTGLGEHSNLGTTNIAFSPTVVASNTFAYNFIENFNISLITKYVSRQYADNTSSIDRSLNPYCVSDIIVDYTFKLGAIKEIKVSLMLNNIFNMQYENNAWVYRYYYNGVYNRMDGYFPQAGINFLAGLKVRF